MKRLLILSCIFSLVLLMTGTSLASPYKGPLVLVEADVPEFDDNDTNVSFAIFNLVSGWSAGEWTDSGFSPFDDENSDEVGIQVTKPAGSIVDFAIQNDSEKECKYLSEGVHLVDFANQNEGTVEKPTWVTEWYNTVSISWDLQLFPNLEIITSNGDPDGFAAVPIPSSLWILASGLLSFVGISRKFTG